MDEGLLVRIVVISEVAFANIGLASIARAAGDHIDCPWNLASCYLWVLSGTSSTSTSKQRICVAQAFTLAVKA